MHTSISPGFSGCRMSSLAGTGNVVWSGLYVVVSTIGLVITVALFDILYINPHNIYYWWYKGLLLIGCMAASVVIFGGLVIALWHLWERKTSLKEEPEDSTKKVDNLQQNIEASLHKNLEEARSVNTIRYGERPDFQGMFREAYELCKVYFPLVFLTVCFNFFFCRDIWITCKELGKCRYWCDSMWSSYSSVQCC